MNAPLTPATPENYLTQAGDVELERRIFTKLIYLGCRDSADNYREITPEEYDQFQAELEAKNELNDNVENNIIE